MSKAFIICPFLVLLVLSCVAFEPSVYDEGSLRTATTFNLASLKERTRPDGVWMSFGQDALEQMLREKKAESYLQKTYYNGTSEAKAYAFGWTFISANPVFTRLAKRISYGMKAN